MSLETLKKLVFEANNKACFIERERILFELEHKTLGLPEREKSAWLLSELLARVSTPIYECDYFAGRVVEALPDEGMNAPNTLLCSMGHLSFDYEKILSVGLKGILQEIENNAKRKGDSESLLFAKNAKTVVESIRNYALRYAKTARATGKEQMAIALEKVPYEPAYDFYSALQSIWLIHLIASCYVGARDYAFGRFDQYMYPYYKKALEKGQSQEELTELLAGFLIKTNEICGRTAWNYNPKPVLSHSSKQYVNIGGETPNEFSSVVLRSACLCNMPQPQIVVLLKSDCDNRFKKEVFQALSVLTDKMNIYNYDLVLQCLLKKGIEERVAKDFTYSACCTFDLNYHTRRMEYFVPVPQIFLSVIQNGNYHSIEEILRAFTLALKKDMQKYANQQQSGYDGSGAFVLDGILLSDSAKECRYPTDGNSKYNVLNLFCPGVATIGDSLLTIDKLVFQSKRYSYEKLISILQADYQGYEELRTEILSYTRFGNDGENDLYTVRVANAFLDAVDALDLKENFYAIGGFYSLDRDNSWASQVGATADGRKSGAPFSENQSPSYGADKSGMLSLLNSIAKLPFERTATGGLNIKFAQKQSAEVLQNLVEGYFKQGGLHIGITVVDKETLEDAMMHPEKYQSLTVRVYGFSEYFVCLPKWQQLAILNRTVYE